jgi:hypothetical protein
LPTTTGRRYQLTTTANNQQQSDRRLQRLPLIGLHLQRLPLQRLPLQRLPLQRLPLQRLPLQRLPLQRLPTTTAYNDYLYNDYLYNDYLYNDYLYNDYLYNDCLYNDCLQRLPTNQRRTRRLQHSCLGSFTLGGRWIAWCVCSRKAVCVGAVQAGRLTTSNKNSIRTSWKLAVCTEHGSHSRLLGCFNNRM